MTPQRDIERVLERWLDDGINEMPDLVYLSILDRVERQPQQRAWRVSWRDSHVRTYTKPLVATAAVLVIAVAGIAFLGRPSDAGVGAVASPTASPAPSPSSAASALPSAAPSASAGFPQWYTSEASGGAGILPAGSQTTKSFVPGFTFTVPEGWVNSADEAGFFGLFPDTPANQAEFAGSGDLAQTIHMGPRNDPYFICDAWEDNQGTTAAEIIAAVIANPAIGGVEPVDVMIGGLTGKQMDLQLNPGWTESCPGDPPGFDLGDTRTRAILLDTANRGVLLILLGSLHSAGHEAFLAEAMPIVESLQFDLNP
jgi:hypothetical protein